MRGPSTFEDLAAVIAVCLGTARADGNFEEIEFKTILEGLRAQYSFEGRDDLLADYVKFANEMDLQEAIRRIKRFDADEKQFTSDMIFMTIASDGKLDPEEEEVYKGMIEVCDLPLFTGADQL